MYNSFCHFTLQARGNELPSPYVKTYLLPDPDKQTKRKTKTIKNTVHPTFNEVVSHCLVFTMREISPDDAGGSFVIMTAIKTVAVQ